MNTNSLKRAIAKGLYLFFIAALATGLALGVVPVHVAHAATFTVNSTADAVDANPGDGVCVTAAGKCTLRAAIMESNALPGDDTITLPTGTYTLTIPGTGEDAAATGDLDITGNLTINGADAATTIIDGNGSMLGDRVFHITGVFTVNISDVTIQNGNVGNGDVGGGISSFGILTLTNSKVINNTAFDGGGLINSPSGTLLLNNTIVSGNTATFGGGIFQGPETQPVQVSGMLILINSTVTSNTAIFGSGISNSSGIVTLDKSTVRNNTDGSTIFNFNGGILTLNNSTISNNNTSDIGGIRNDSGTVTLNNSTISNNTGNLSGGISNVDTVNLRNTILAGNLSQEPFPDCRGTLISQGYNLIQHTSGCIIGGDTTGNLIGMDPMLGPLQDNGGPTFTHALLPGSPAINAGNPASPGSGGNACEATDQRGVARPQDARCDIGAFEAPVNVNSELSGRVKLGTSTFNPQPVPDGPAGTFAFTAEFCNIGDERLIFLKSVTAVLTGGSTLLNRDSGTPPGVGSELTFAANRDYMDLTLDGGECVDVPYVIGLARRAPFEFFVDVLGVVTDDTRQ
jgi:CSLREA domain-containing protein